MVLHADDGSFAFWFAQSDAAAICCNVRFVMEVIEVSNGKGRANL